MRILIVHLLSLVIGVELTSCTSLRALPTMRTPPQRSLEVTATAYNSVPEQTDDTPFIAAWGDRLDPAVASIAVSRDLLEMGLTRGTSVRIEELDADFVVLDKMHPRWKRRIDIYMGLDVEAARRWGKRRVTISWTATPD